MAARNPRTKHDFQNLRTHSWACLRCFNNYGTKTTICDCGGKVQYFASKDELKRFNQLRILVEAGRIKNLICQPCYPVSINQIEVFKYKADFIYTDIRTRAEVVEDVKGTTNEKYLDPVFKIKKKCVEAFYGIKIKVVKP